MTVSWNQGSRREFALKVTQEGIMWFAITSMAFGAAIGLNVFALWVADRFGQLQKRG
jgi:hypothetical protein